jgi:nitrogen regulatory protein PII
MLNPTLIVTVVRNGWGNAVLKASIKAGATGGTLLTGRGIGVNEKESIFGIAIEPGKEILLTLVEQSEVEPILQAIVDAARLEESGHGLAFVIPVTNVVGMPHAGPAQP